MVVNVLSDGVRTKVNDLLKENRERGNTRAELKNSMLEALYLKDTGRGGFAYTYDDRGKSSNRLYLYMYDRYYADMTFTVNLPTYLNDDGVNHKLNVVIGDETERYPGLICMATEIVDATIAWFVPYRPDGNDFSLYNLEYDISKVDFSIEDILCVFTCGKLDIEKPVYLSDITFYQASQVVVFKNKYNVATTYYLSTPVEWGKGDKRGYVRFESKTSYIPSITSSNNTMFSNSVCQETQGLHRFCGFMAAYGLDRYNQIAELESQIDGLLKVIDDNITFIGCPSVYDKFELFWYIYAVALQGQEYSFGEIAEHYLDEGIMVHNLRGTFIREAFTELGIDVDSKEFNKLIFDMVDYLRQFNDTGRSSLITDKKCMLVGNHKDLNKNNNSVYNLELITNEENLFHYAILHTLAITKLCNSVCEIYQEDSREGVKNKIRFKPGYGIGIWDIREFEDSLSGELRNEIKITYGSIINLLIAVGRAMKDSVDNVIMYQKAAEDRTNGINVSKDIKCLEVACLHPSLLTALILFLGKRYESYRRLCECYDIRNIWYDNKDTYLEAFSSNAFTSNYKSKKIAEIKPPQGYSVEDDSIVNSVFISNQELHDAVKISNAEALSNSSSVQSFDMDLLVEYYKDCALSNNSKLRNARLSEDMANEFADRRAYYINKVKDNIFDKYVSIYYKYFKDDAVKQIVSMIGNASTLYALVSMFVDNYHNKNADLVSTSILEAMMQRNFFDLDTSFDFTKDLDDDNLILTKQNIPALTIDSSACHVKVTDSKKFKSFLRTDRGYKWDPNSTKRSDEECTSIILKMFSRLGNLLCMSDAAVFASNFGVKLSYTYINREGLGNNYFVYDFVKNIDNTDKINCYINFSTLKRNGSL